MQVELLPCPFCGGEAIFHDCLRPPETYPCRVYCDNCWAEAGSYSTEAEAIAAWNSRAERLCRIEEKQEEWQYDFGVKDYTFSCGHTIGWAHTYEPSYCPNCGAKVVGE